MRNNLHWSVQLSILVGIIGLFVISKSLWWGTLMVLAGLIVPIMVILRRSQQRTASAPKPRIQKEPSPARPAPAVKAGRKVSQPARSSHRNVDRNKLSLLRYTLHQANLDSSAPVFETGEGQAVTVRDILVEMIDIAEAHGRSTEALAKDIVAMYPRIFENVDAALQQYSDEESAKVYIARKAMADIRGTMD